MAHSITNHGQISKFFSYSVLEVTLQNHEISTRVDDLQKTYDNVNLTPAMSDLSNVEELLKAAAIASRSYKCNQLIIPIVKKHHELINNSCWSFNNYMEHSLMALNKHVLALKAVERGNVPMAIKLISQCEQCALEMEKLSSFLAKTADNLASESLEAMKIVSEDPSVSIGRCRQVEQIVVNYKSVEANQKRLAEVIQGVRELEVMDSGDHKRMLAIFQIGTNAVPNVPDSATSTIEDLEHEQRVASSNLKELNSDKDELEMTLQSLDVAIQKMIMVRIAFEKVSLFWGGVAANCNAMAQFSSRFDEIEDFDEVKSMINDSGLSLITLCKMNHAAQSSLGLFNDDESVKSIKINFFNQSSARM